MGLRSSHGSVLRVQPSTGEWKLATAAEHLGALGFHVFADDLADTGFEVSKLAQIVLSTLSPGHVKLLCGNAMHLVTQASWMAYVLANVVRKPKVDPRIIKQSSWDLLDDADLEAEELE